MECFEPAVVCVSAVSASARYELEFRVHLICWMFKGDARLLKVSLPIPEMQGRYRTIAIKEACQN